MTTRYKLTLEYDGSDFVGWQRQDNGRSIQQSIEEAIERFSGERVRVFQLVGRGIDLVQSRHREELVLLLRDLDADLHLA